MTTTAPEKDTIPVPVPATASQADSALAQDAALEQDLLVEDVSIDGMCGVY